MKNYQYLMQNTQLKSSFVTPAKVAPVPPSILACARMTIVFIFFVVSSTFASCPSTATGTDQYEYVQEDYCFSNYTADNTRVFVESGDCPTGFVTDNELTMDSSNTFTDAKGTYIWDCE